MRFTLLKESKYDFRKNLNNPGKCILAIRCLTDCGEDAHDHVATCDAKPLGADRHFATAMQYNSAWRHRRQRLLDDYLTVELRDKDIQAKVEQQLRRDLAELGLVFATSASVRSGTDLWLGPKR